MEFNIRRRLNEHSERKIKTQNELQAMANIASVLLNNVIFTGPILVFNY